MSNARFTPERPMSPIARIRRWLVRVSFTSTYRLPFYEALRFLLENERPPQDAFQMIGDVYTDFGRKWSPYLELVGDCLESMGDNRPGHTLTDALAAWVPDSEAALLGAGIKTGKLPLALKQADKMINARQRIFLQVLIASIYPLVFLFLGGALLAVNQMMIIPVMSKTSRPETWTGALGIMYSVSEFTRNWGPESLVIVVFLALLSFWSLPRWRGRTRKIFDNAMPWSLYSDLQGAVFMMNMASLISSGTALLESLQVLRGFSSPWLSERLDAVILAMNDGKSTLGRALRNSGYDFPDRQSANYLSVISGGKGADAFISNYADRYLETTITRVIRRANMARLGFFFLILGFFALMVMMILQIQDMTNMTTHSLY